MIKVPRHERKVVYAIVNRNSMLAYVGATFSLKRRLGRHRASGSIVAELLTLPDTSVSSSESMPLSAALKLERESIDEHIDAGFLMLNRNSGGTPGGMSLKWTEERIAAAVGQFASRYSLQREESGLYARLLALGRLDEFFRDAERSGRRILKHGTITKKACMELAKSFAFRDDFMKAHPTYGVTAYKNGWIDEIFSFHEGHGYKRKPSWA